MTDSPTNNNLEKLQDVVQQIKGRINSIIFGQDTVIDAILIGLLSEGHLLIEGLPGTAKTSLVKLIAQLIAADFKRIQLTPDMLPAEITGTHIFDLNERQFILKEGPVFTDLLLADEINRTPPKTQSALLEAMEERQVTLDGTTRSLSDMFTVIATLNPIELEGTYPLPEAQLDRFMLKVNVTYPSLEKEREMLQHFSKLPSIQQPFKEGVESIVSLNEFMAFRQTMNQITVSDDVMDYILNIITDTRQNPNIQLGCSPRSAISLMAASRGYAAINGKAFVTPDDVKAIAPSVISHRIILSTEAELDGLTINHVIQQTLGKIPVPR